MSSIDWETRRRRLDEYHSQRTHLEAAWDQFQRDWELDNLQPSLFSAFCEGYKAATQNAVNMIKGLQSLVEDIPVDKENNW